MKIDDINHNTPILLEHIHDLLPGTMEETLRQWNRPVRIDRSRKHANATPAIKRNVLGEICKFCIILCFRQMSENFTHIFCII